MPATARPTALSTTVRMRGARVAGTLAEAAGGALAQGRISVRSISGMCIRVVGVAGGEGAGRGRSSIALRGVRARAMVEDGVEREK